ncbi:MAG: hypothetical protein K6G62_07310 [Eubacterium sp.]|nr:hypothetical protein [Eubacterium sp.]
MKIEAAVTIFSGFVESGKTTSLLGTLERIKDLSEGKSLVICTEEGEVEYPVEALKSLNVEVVYLEEEEDLNLEFLKEMDEKYQPADVYIEFNGMWDLREFIKKELPEEWVFTNIFAMVDGTTYDLYLQNMRQVIMNPLAVANVILFNRCSEDFSKAKARRALKILNPSAEIFFTRLDGSVDYGLEELEMQDQEGVYHIVDEIFCSWFVDCLEHADKYYGKRVNFRGVVTRGEGLGEGEFYVGRYAAICCPEDAQFVGFIAKYNGPSPKNASWVQVQGQLAKGEINGNKEVIFLLIESLQAADQPHDIFLYF